MLFLVLVALVFLLIHHFKKKGTGAPEIHSVTPMVALPGDSMVIKGENFGAIRGSSYVEIAGSRLTGSSYKIWTDKEIQLTLPLNVQDGLVVVVTGSGQSVPSFFANRENIPVVIQSDPQTDLPVIHEISPTSASIGQIVTITGNNFGSVRGNSLVYFTANRNDRLINAAEEEYIPSIEDDFICASDVEFDYNSWSDTEIRVRVPDGADSGSVFVMTAKGESDSMNLDLSFPAGKKTYRSKKTYLIQTRQDYSRNNAQEGSVTLYMPRPQIAASQPKVVLREVNYDPLIKDDANDLIYQIPLNGTDSRRYTQTYAVTTYEVNSNIKGTGVQRYVNTRRTLFTTYTAQDPAVPSEDEAVIALKDEIVGREKNPYKQAQLIYNYFIENYGIANRSAESSISNLMISKKGDAYDLAMLYTALCRSAGILAVPVSGLLIDSSLSCRNHWWCELYFENYGWFPVDVAIPCGVSFKPSVSLEGSLSEYYFGNMDAQHLAFSRGWNQIKTSISNVKPVYRAKTYALQSVWEDASSESARYSCTWTNPRVLGVE